MNKSKFSEQYCKAIYTVLEDMSSTLNSGSQDIKKKLEHLEKLLSTGKTDKDFIDKINKELIQNIASFSSKKSQMNISIKKSPEKFQILLENLKKEIDLEIEKNTENLNSNFLLFKEKFKQILENGIDDIFFNDKIMNISCPETEQDLAIIDEYVQNYIGLLNNKEIKFKEETIVNYFRYLEYKVSQQIEEEASLVNDNIRQAVYSSLDDLFITINETNDIQLFDKILKEIKVTFSWLENTSDNENVDYELKNFILKIKKSIIELAQSANMEILPKILEEKVNQSTNNFRDKVVQIKNIIKELEEQRSQIFNILSQSKLDEYYNYVNIQEENIIDYKTSWDEIKTFFIKSKTFTEFVLKRNIEGDKIKKQLDESREDSYSGIKKQLDSITEIQSNSIDNDIINYFIQSVKLFMAELENTILGDLDADINDIIVNIRQVIPSEYKAINEVKKLEDEELIKIKQEKINIFLGKLTGYKLPEKVVNELVKKFNLNTEKDVELFLKKYTDESFSYQIYQFLNEKSLEELFDLNFEKIENFKEISSKMTELQVTKIREYGPMMIEITKSIFGFSALSLGTSSISIAGVMFASAFSIYKSIKDSGLKEQDAVNKMNEDLKQIINQVGTLMIKEKFEASLK